MTTARPNRTRGAAIVIGVLVLAVAIAGAAGLWYLFFRPAGPAPVSLASLPPVAASQSTDGSSAASADPTAEAASDDPAATTSTARASPGRGTSTRRSARATPAPSSATGSRRQLATVGAAEAVGRTSNVTGSLTIDGTTITAVDMTADLTTLQSDEANRDRQLQRQGIETATYPTATFTLTQPIELDAVPAEGEIVNVTATGDLMLHGVTKSVEIPLETRLEGGVITRGRLAADPVRRLQHRPAAGDDRPLGRGSRDAGAAAALHARVISGSSQGPVTSIGIDAALPADSSPPRAPRSCSSGTSGRTLTAISGAGR